MDNQTNQPNTTDQPVTPVVPETVEQTPVATVSDSAVEPTAPAAEPATLEINHSDTQPVVEPVVAQPVAETVITPVVETTPQPAVAPQPVAPQQPVQVQYVINERSLEGLGGWLAYYLAALSIGGLFFIAVFFQALTDLSTQSTLPLTTNLIFAPIVAATSIAGVVYIAMQKKLGKLMAITSIIATGIYSAALIIANAVQDKQIITPIMIGTILIMLIGYGLYSLYFFVSKRVAKTLVK